MTRNILLALAGSGLFSLASCGKTDENTESKSDANASSTSEAGADPKLFAETYLYALQNKDTPKLDSMMLTDGVPAETVEFFKTMREEPGEGTSLSVEVTTPSPEDLAKFAGEQEMPDGKMYKMPMTPTHLLKITAETKDASGESKSSSSMPIAEKDGRFVILLPVPAG